MNKQQAKIYRGWCAFNYETPIFSTISRTAKEVWPLMNDLEKDLYYEGFETGNSSMMQIRKIEFQIVEKFTK